MITRRLLILSFVLFATGIWLLAGYCNGGAGLSADFPSPGLTLKLDIATIGPAANAGVPLTVFGALLLSIAAIGAAVSEIRSMFSKPKPTTGSALTGNDNPGAD